MSTQQKTKLKTLINASDFESLALMLNPLSTEDGDHLNLAIKIAHEAAKMNRHDVVTWIFKKCEIVNHKRILLRSLELYVNDSGKEHTPIAELCRELWASIAE